MKQWLRKKYGKSLSTLVVLGIFLMPMNIFNSSLSLHRSSGTCMPSEPCMASTLNNVSSGPNMLSGLRDGCSKEIIKEVYECCEASKQHVIITPDRFGGLNLRELLRVIVDCAHETKTLHELPQGLIRCCEAVENGARTVHAEDLQEALPVIIEKIMDPTMMKMLSRAPRPTSPFNHTAVVGPLVCDFTEIIGILEQLLAKLNQCCNNQQACCLIIIDLLVDLQNTLTTCCADIQVNFDGTFTVLASLSTVTLMIACDLSSVFTVLDDINNTLTTCCADISNNFDGTFTVLNTLNNTFTSCCTNIESTFTVLADIKDTLTTCCADIQVNFDGTFTVLAALSTPTVTCDFSSIFTVLTEINNTLTDCCADIQVNFNGTFTVLANLGTATCDFSSVFTVLNSINTTLTSCCANITNNFNGTFTAIASISIAACDLSGVYTAIAAITSNTCCSCDLSGVYTVLGSTSDNPPTFTTLPNVADTYLTTTFNVIEWLKAIYAQVHYLSFGN